MRVLMISSRADVGGGPEHIRVLIRGLQRCIDGIEIAVACPKEPPYYEIFQSLVGDKRLVEIPHRAFSIRHLVALWAATRRFNPSIIHSHGKGAGLYGRILGLLTRTPVVHTFHGVHVGGRGRTYRWLYALYERVASRVTAALVAVSESELRKVIDLLGGRSASIVTIRNGVEEDYGKHIGSTGGLFTVVTTSRFDYQKNAEETVALFGLFQRKYNGSSRLVVLGDGPGREVVRQLVVDAGIQNVCMDGAVTDTRAYFRAADAYLNTSRWEGLSLALLEAMACGLPVVATAVTGNEDIVNDGEVGYLYKLGEVQEGADKLLQLATDALRTAHMGARARALVTREYGSSKMATDYAALYSTLAPR